MLEGLVAWVLNNYLGQYVENLNTDQLSVALLSGKVELENLPLKKDALKHFGLSVEVKAGFIGRVQLQVPVRQIRSAPWLIAIEKLYVVAGPINLDEWDGEAEACAAHERKVAALDALEARWRAEHEAADAGYYAASYSSWLSYGTGLLANIAENLQLTLTDVHFRYEDTITCAPRAFACGLSLGALRAESCDALGRPAPAAPTAPAARAHKLLELRQLALYWDPLHAPTGCLADLPMAELMERMAAPCAGEHAYLLRPASGAARVQRELTPVALRSRTRPRLSAHLTLESVDLNLTAPQYGEAVGCAAGLARLARLREWRALRPLTPVRGHARAWWLYALRCHRPHCPWTQPRATWESCVQQARDTREYVSTCVFALRSPAATLAAPAQRAKEQFEWRHELRELRALREVAMRLVPATPPAGTPEAARGAGAAPGRGLLLRWFPQWWGWYGAAPQPPDGAQAAGGAEGAAGELEEEILDAIADSLENDTVLKRDSVFGRFEFQLLQGCLNIAAGDEPEGEAGGVPAGSGMELQFSALVLRVESRPRAAAHALHVSLGALTLRERITRGSLFPVLVAPQGMIREGLSAMNATASAMAWCRAHAASPPPAPRPSPPPAPAPAPVPAEPLFQLEYEKKPFGLNCTYKLWVKSASLEVVYSRAAAEWVRQFALQPWRHAPARALAPAHAYAHVRDSTRERLREQWDHMLHPHPGERVSWQVELDISAPQILLVQELCSRDASVLLVDFGRLRLANAAPPAPAQPPAQAPRGADEEEEETFMTPCSTPPGSLLSPASPHAPPAPAAPLDAHHLHTTLYDRYNIELSDLQILVGRARDNWKYAHTKSTSSLHLLDRFSISLQCERRVVATSDPQYPSAALCGSLPALVAHLSEAKLCAVLALLPAALRRDQAAEGVGGASEADAAGGADDCSESSDTERSELSQQSATLFVLQFAIDQLSLEVQSRGRSIAEVQVCGVRAGAALRPADALLSLSVHSLLLVDALQTYGPDFELLVASHKHLGMDTASGSIRDSEPTSPSSPTSPASPAAPLLRAAPAPHAHPLALHHALNSLHSHPEADRTSPAPSWNLGTGGSSSTAHGPLWGGWGSSGTAWDSNSAWAPQPGFTNTWAPQPGSGTTWAPQPGSGGSTWAPQTGFGAAGLADSEALIAVELCLVKGDGDSEDLRIANILFNNLDIIANQETIVELIGFVQRVLGDAGAAGRQSPPDGGLAGRAASLLAVAPDDERQKETRTEITFDFHRLGVLLLRAAVLDGAVVARKIATATVSEAKIQATVDGSRVSVGGSLGGVQVVSLCEGAGVHSRVLAAGRAPRLAHAHDDDKALLFDISRVLEAAEGDDAPVVQASVSVHVASVWYTHSGALLRELQSCLSEFKQYLANLARSIRAAAADMALGLVHPRADSLYANPKLSQSTEGVSPRRRTTSMGGSLDDPPDLQADNIVLSVSIELESPVVVLPRAAHSTEVFVAHLGRMSLSNRPGAPHNKQYRVRVRDISLTSLDVCERLKSATLGGGASMAHIYDASRGKPVLHNTALQLQLTYGAEAGATPRLCSVSGQVVGGLHVSARREQYEQLLETARWVSSAHAAPPAGGGEPSTHQQPGPLLEASSLVAAAAVPTLRLDPTLRAARAVLPAPASPAAPAAHTPIQVVFSLPMLTVELRADLGGGERSLVQLAFREFSLRHQSAHPHESELQVSLHSITMEDLTQEPDSKHRLLMVSHTPPAPPKAVYVSKSCPNLVAECARPRADPPRGGALRPARRRCASLPAQLNAPDETMRRSKRESKCGITPPCSPEPAAAAGGTGAEGAELAPGDDLVWVSVHTRDPAHPLFDEKYNKVSRLTKVQFNCLQLVVSIDSWVAVLDFFGVAADEPRAAPHAPPPAAADAEDSAPAEDGITQTETSVRSLSVVLVSARGEACRARVRRVLVVGRAHAARRTRHIAGRLGALRLADLAPHAPLWRDRFRTHGDHALTIEYRRLSSAEAALAGHETSLSVEMGPSSYVHTKRFVQELQAFARDFSLLRRVIQQARLKVSVGAGPSPLHKMRLRVRCRASVIVVPASGRSRAALVAELQSLHVDNCFKFAGDEGTATTRTDSTCLERELLDVRVVQLHGLSLWAARGGRGLRVRRAGPPLLPAPTDLTLHVEHNLTQSRNVPEMTVWCALTTLQCALDGAQYRLVRAVLAHNLGEPCADLLPPAPAPAPAPAQQVWTTTSLKLELHDVSVRLEPQHGAASLACINFIKSRLLVEAYSDLSQDIDLVSQEILVSDTRYAREPANRRANVFSHIVQPMPDHPHSVQAEVHARKRGDSSAYTILVNNMRLMAVLDWWEAALQFIMQPPPPPCDADQPPLEDPLSPRGGASSPLSLPVGGAAATAAAAEAHMELKLNVTDSQLVLVEDASLWDTNAVILKSTAVITYRAADAAKPVSCELNELEVFSCVLGLEEETALSIVEPAALHVALRAGRVLHVGTGALSLRLSYHDMRMFAAMLRSLPAQARAALSGKLESSDDTADAPANSVHMRAGAGGGARAGAGKFYAPRWTRAPPAAPPPSDGSAIWPLKAVQVTAECVTLCVIDDCLDSDVPLLELALSDLRLDQDLRKAEEAFEDPLLVCTPAGPAPAAGAAGGGAGAGGGRLSGVLSADYYNRTLSGWEPFVEPWRLEARWEYTLSSALSLRRVQVDVTSADVLCANVTSSLIDLARLVRDNWTQDYYAPQTAGAEQSPKGSPAGARRRAPFVPYALRNHTGRRLWFTTLLTASDSLEEDGASPAAAAAAPDDSWVSVRAGDTEPFSFGRARPRAAPHAAAPAPLHRLALRLDGWAPPEPVCVDRVGVYFRRLAHTKSGAEARIVLEVSLEGSARKLVTVRSALRVLNGLPHPVEIRLEPAPTTGCAARRVRALCGALAAARCGRVVAAPCARGERATRHLHPISAGCAQWSGGASAGARVTVAAGAAWAAPLSERAGTLWARPLLRAPFAFAPVALDWRAARGDASVALLHAECRAPPNDTYRFCCVVVRERFPPDVGEAVPGHTLRLLPALRLENLLPVELQFRAAHAGQAAYAAHGALPPADTRPFHEVNVEEGVELSVKLEGFGWSSALSVRGVGGGAGAGAGGGSFGAQLKLRDARGRRLYLSARITVKKTDGVKVSISAAYWLVNRTGLPLVFRAEGAASEAAGQGAEHEVARCVAPLLFSFAEAEGGPTVSARLGAALAPHAEWCSPFGLGVGVCVKRLTARGATPDAPERVHAVGVWARAGRGRYRHTNIVTLTPRYQLHNNTALHLQFAQKCTATTLSDPGAMSTHVWAVPGCYLPWHWPRCEREPLLCVRAVAPPAAGAAAPEPLTAWSGGFRIDTARTLHLACREAGGAGWRLLRLQVAEQAASLFVVASAAHDQPPPLRIDNHSPVAIMFHQVGCGEESVVGAHARALWALPEPEGACALALRAPGGPRSTLSLALDTAPATTQLLYQNFIYIVFSATAATPHTRELPTPPGEAGEAAGDEGALVLEVPLNSTRVVLARKRYGERAQLWRRTVGGQLLHEGSSPPQPTDALQAADAALSPHALVLDIADAAPRPGRASALLLRRADPRRASTQAWRLAAGRMACAHSNLCVQPDGGFMALAPGSRVVLGLPEPGRCARGGALPAEQAVSWHSLRPGSGRLDVALTADGPTRLVRITDHKAPDSGWVEGGEEACSPAVEAARGEWGLRVALAGLSLSLVARAPPQELVHARLGALALDASAAPRQARFALLVQHMQWDNQLLGTPSPVLLHCLPERAGAGAGAEPALPALHVSAQLARGAARRHHALVVQHLVLTVRPLAVRLEERLILKLWQWAAPDDEAGAREQPDEADYAARRALDELTALRARRCYVALLRVAPSQIRLSMVTASKLEPSLLALRRRLGLTLINFEDAAVELEPFVLAHACDTPAALGRQLLQHFRDELKWQAAKILGSVDFLGNPLGFVADVSEGVSGLLLEGNVQALLQNVTHGLSNSAAKVTESLGDGLERVVGDEAHEDTRRRIRDAAAGAHLAAGLRGLGLGLLGGMTSLVKHSYEGAAAEGLTGFLTGVGKGLVGTVAKPVIGVLDLAAETASALRDTSRRSDKCLPVRVRAPRCAAGAGGLLPRYCARAAEGAALLHALPGAGAGELFLAYRTVRGAPHDIRALLSHTHLRIVTCRHATEHAAHAQHAPHAQVVMETHLSNLVSCAVVEADGAHLVELAVRGGGDGVRRPRVQCDSAALAAWVVRHAACARQLQREHAHTLRDHDADQL